MLGAAMGIEEMKLWSRVVWLSAEHSQLGGWFKVLSSRASSLIHDKRAGFQRRSAVSSWICNSICPSIPNYKGSHWRQIARNADTLSGKRSIDGLCTTDFEKWSRSDQSPVSICERHSRWASRLSPGATATIHSWSLFPGSGDALRASSSVCWPSTAEKRAYIDGDGHHKNIGGSASTRWLSGFGLMKLFGEDGCARRLDRSISSTDHKPHTCGRGRHRCQMEDGCKNHQKLGLQGFALCDEPSAYAANVKAYSSNALQSLPISRLSLLRSPHMVRGIRRQHGGHYRSDGGTMSHPFAVVNSSLVSCSEHFSQSHYCRSNSHIGSSNNKATADLHEWGGGVPEKYNPFDCSMLSSSRHISLPRHGIRHHSCSSNELKSSEHQLGSPEMLSGVHFKSKSKLQVSYGCERMYVLPFTSSSVNYQPNFGHSLPPSFSSSVLGDTVSRHLSPSAFISSVRSENSTSKQDAVPCPSSYLDFSRNLVVLPSQKRSGSITGTGIGGMRDGCLWTSRGNGLHQNVRSFFHLCSAPKDSRKGRGVDNSGRRQESVGTYVAGKGLCERAQLSHCECCVGRQTRGVTHGRYSELSSNKPDQGGLVNRDCSSGHVTEDTLRMNAFAVDRQSMSIEHRTDDRVDGKGAMEDAGDGGMDLRDGTCHNQGKDDTLTSGGVKVDNAGKQISVQDRLVQAGWTRQEVLNWPNALSMARLFSGPLIAMWVMQGDFSAALIGLAAAGLSDWLDGFIAKRYGSVSVVGSYLDPLADKVLVCCLATALAVKGYLSPGLVVLVVARDAALVGGAFVYRAYHLSWKWQGFSDFFNVTAKGAPIVKPLLISKVNTGAQLALVGSALSMGAFGFPDAIMLEKLGYVVIGTTLLSWAGYGKVILEKAGTGGLDGARSQSTWLSATKSKSRKRTLIAAVQMREADRKYPRGHPQRADVEKKSGQMGSECNDIERTQPPRNQKF